LPEVTAMDDEQPNRRVSEHSRRPGSPVQETHFAEELPGTNAMMTLRRHLDPGGPINDKEEMIAGLSRAREDLPGRGRQRVALRLIARSWRLVQFSKTGTRCR